VQRLLFFIVVCGWLAVPALAQKATDPTDASSRTRAQVSKSQIRPPEQIPTRYLRGYSDYLGEEADLGSPADTLTEAQILRRLSRLYQHQADILTAQADGDVEHTEGLLDLAMIEVGVLMQQEGITERPRFRELYRTIVTEYERYYGVSDTALYMPHGSVYELRADIFAAMDEVEEPLLEDVTLPPLPPMITAVPMTQNRIVEQTINYFLQKKQDVLERWMARADTYFPMIEQIFREEGVPDELKYLAMVESGLNPRARSWARAVGMWQFINATGSAYGLQVNSWVDERMDPEKSTRAAARHLKDLYAMYGNNWHVALAGYNCSPRCIKRAISRAGGTMDNPPSYWEMYPYLPRETRGYVPQFIAFALIMSNPSAFGLTDVPPGPRYAYDYVPVEGMLSLDDVARMVGTDEATIKALNPELRRETLPPSRSAYMLRVPYGSYAQFAAAFENLPDNAKRPVGEYVVRRGDSLGKIATQHGVSVEALRSSNDLRGSTIHPGQRLVVPVAGYSGTVSLADARPISVEYHTRTIRPIQPEGTLAVNTQPTPIVRTAEVATTPRSTATTPSSGPSQPETSSAASSQNETRVVYQVRRGDSLSKIAEKYGVGVSDIQGWNNLRSTRIKSGQRLTIYPTDKAQPESLVYTVRRGDNLTEIGKKYNVSVGSIKQWNSLRNSRITIGQRLTIHPGQTAPRYTVYKVRRGDSLGKIATKYGKSVSKLKEWNSLRSNTIHPGQRLKIY